MVEKTGSQEINDSNWKSIELAPDWYVVPHPNGTGIGVQVFRGINCEGHVHLITSHCNSVQDMYGCLKIIIEKHKQDIEEAISGFINMQNNMFKWNYQHMRGYKESLSSVFMQGLADWLIYEAGEIECATLLNSLKSNK